MVCQAFNADFDNDGMAVHLPLSAEGAGRGPRAHALVEQHPLAGEWPAARDAQPGYGHSARTSSRTASTISCPCPPPTWPRRSGEERAPEIPHGGGRGVRLGGESVGYRDRSSTSGAASGSMTTPGRVIFNAEVEQALDEGDRQRLRGSPVPQQDAPAKRELDAFISELVEDCGPVHDRLGTRRHQVAHVPLRDPLSPESPSRRTTSSSRATRRRFSPTTRRRSRRSSVSTTAA